MPDLLLTVGAVTADDVTAIASATDIQRLAEVANVVSWCRDRKTLSLILDNKAIDRRFCVELGLGRNEIKIQVLSGFNAAKNCWSAYVSQGGNTTLPNRRGEKSLLEWIRRQAEEQTGYPNPEFFTLYRR